MIAAMKYGDVLQKLTGYYAALVCIIILAACASSGKQQAPVSWLIIRNINVVDVLTGKIISRQDVVVKDQLIYFIGNPFREKIPGGAVTLEGEGRYLSPGLWDMHTHICWDKNNDSLLFPILLANGITGLRDMGGDLDILRSFNHASNNAQPTIMGAGPMIDGNPPVYTDFSIAADERTDMTKVLDSLQNRGAHFFKTYSLLKEPQLQAIASYCKKHNMHFAGHLSEYIEPEVSIRLHQKSIEHLNRLDEIWTANKTRLDSIADLMLTNNTFLCPTLITYQLKTKLRDSSIINPNYAKYIAPALMKEWQTAWAKRQQRHTQPADWKELENNYASQLNLVKHMHQKGVLLLAGSDFAGMPYVYPGIGLQQELKLLVTAGLSDWEALKTATINPALYRGEPQLYGSINTGKYADMLILKNNPLEEIENLEGIEWVISKGKVQRFQN